MDLDENSESETNHGEAREIEKPDYCRDETDETLKKKKCQSCKSSCNLTKDDLSENSKIIRATVEDSEQFKTSDMLEEKQKKN